MKPGQASAVEVRGTVHWLTHRDGPARALAVTPDARARLPQVLGRTGQVAWVSDAGGADALEIAPAAGPELAAGAARRRARGGWPKGSSAWSASWPRRPDGSTVAVAARDGRLLLVDVASGAVTQLAESQDGAVSGLAYAPDSAWLAWSHPGPPPLSRIRLARLADGQRGGCHRRAGSSTPSRPSPGTASTWPSCPRGSSTRSTTRTSSTCRSRTGRGPTWCRWPPRTPSPFGPLPGGPPSATGR